MNPTPSQPERPEPKLYEISALVCYHVVLLAESEKDAKEHVETWEECWPSSADLVGVSDVEIFDIRAPKSSDWRDEAHEMTSAVRKARHPEDFRNGKAVAARPKSPDEFRDEIATECAILAVTTPATRTAPEAVAWELELVECPTCSGSGEVHSHNNICWACLGRGKLHPDAAKGAKEAQDRWNKCNAPTPPEADKDAEIARMKVAHDDLRDRLVAYLDSPEGQNRMAAEQRDTANRACDDMEKQLEAAESDLTTARASIAERDRRIAELVEALQFYADISNFHVTVWEDETKDGKCWLEPASEHSLQEEKDGSSDFGIRALDALAHAAKGKEQA